MPSVVLKIIVLILLFAGEALAIYVEMLGARNATAVSQPLFQIFLKLFLLMMIAGGFLIAGYMLGFSAFKNIWIVSAASITSILIIEPILAWTMFHQMPTTGAFIGFGCGVIGLLAAILF